MFDTVILLKTVGYLGLFAIVFAESGLLIGLFLPGDSLLFTAGILASQGYFNIFAVIAISFTAAVVGDAVGFYFGRKVGPRIFTRDDSIFFQRAHLGRAEKFYTEHGGKTLVLARFMPVIRTLAPIIAGVSNMRYTAFVTYNIIGAVLWGIGLPAAGYFLGRIIPGIDRYLIPIVILIVVLSFAPGLFPILKDRDQRKALWQALKRYLKR